LTHQAGTLSEPARREVASLREHPPLAGFWQAVRSSQADMASLARRIAEIPAPPFQEETRGRWVAERLREFTGRAPESDALGNRWAVLPGAQGRGKRLLVSAHLDTVFPAGTDCTVRERDGKLCGPGIGDNSAGLAVLLTFARLLTQAGFPFAGEVVIAANVGEEGLGDLRGMKALCAQWGATLDGTLALDGGLGHVVGEAVGSRRYRVTVRGPGGHSWSEFGTPSAIHHLARLAAGLAGLEVADLPRAAFNIGEIRGGTSVNTIAAHAEMLVDLRSIDAAALAELDARAQRGLHAVPCPKDLDLAVEKIGERPTGDPKLTREWVDVATAACAALGLAVKVTASSTDANAPLSVGIHASTLGVCRAGRAHTLDEWLDPSSLPLGLEALALTVLAALKVFPAKG